jgi:hypothetical protein
MRFQPIVSSFTDYAVAQIQNKRIRTLVVPRIGRVKKGCASDAIEFVAGVTDLLAECG